MDWRFFCGLALAAAMIGGCTGNSVGVGGKPKEKGYSSIVSLSPSTTEIIGIEGGTQYVVGKTAACDRTPGTENAAIVVSGVTPDYEKIAALKPDLIVYDASLYGADELAKIKQTGAETLEYNPTTIDDYADFCYRLASKFSLETQASSYLDRVYNELAAASATKTSEPRTTVLLGPEAGGYLVMGVDGFHASILKACGATPVGPSGRLFQVAKLERLVDWDPEVIYSDGHAQEIYQDPRLQSLSAVKNHHVYDINAKSLVRIGGELDKIVKLIAHDLEGMPENKPKVTAK